MTDKPFSRKARNKPGRIAQNKAMHGPAKPLLTESQIAKRYRGTRYDDRYPRRTEKDPKR